MRKSTIKSSYKATLPIISIDRFNLKRDFIPTTPADFLSFTEISAMDYDALIASKHVLINRVGELVEYILQMHFDQSIVNKKLHPTAQKLFNLVLGNSYLYDRFHSSVGLRAFRANIETKTMSVILDSKHYDKFGFTVELSLEYDSMLDNWSLVYLSRFPNTSLDHFRWNDSIPTYKQGLKLTKKRLATERKRLRSS